MRIRIHSPAPKPNQKHHLDPIDLLMDNSGSGFLKSGSRLAKKPGPIRIRNTGTNHRLTDLKQNNLLSLTEPDSFKYLAIFQKVFSNLHSINTDPDPA